MSEWKRLRDAGAFLFMAVGAEFARRRSKRKPLAVLESARLGIGRSTAVSNSAQLLIYTTPGVPFR